MSFLYTVSVKELIGLGIVSGVTIEFANWIRKEGRYKNIVGYILNYPGISLATISCVTGMGIVFVRFVL